MKITQLKQQVRSSNRVNVFVDNKYAFSLTLDQIIQEKIKVGQLIDAERLAALQELSQLGKLYSQALDWLMRRPHSVKELHDYLCRKKVSLAHAPLIVERLEGAGHLNDETFARWWYASRVARKKSLRSIVTELKTKGVSDDIIRSIQDRQDKSADDFSTVATEPASDLVSLRAVVDKVSGRSRYADKNKLMRYLLSKGFLYADVRTVLAELAETDKD